MNWYDFYIKLVYEYIQCFISTIKLICKLVQLWWAGKQNDTFAKNKAKLMSKGIHNKDLRIHLKIIIQGLTELGF